MLSGRQIGFVGGGNMAEALLAGVLRKALTTPEHLIVSDPLSSRREWLARNFGVVVTLTQVFPSGWEIRNSRMEGTGSATAASYYDYQDVRDDRVLTYLDLWRGGSVTYKVMLNASYAGRLYLPGTLCEAMYDNTISGRTQGKWVTVVKPGEALSGQ